MNRELKIGKNIFKGTEWDEFKIPYADLGNLKLQDLPQHGSVEIDGFKIDGFHFSFSVKYQNNEDGVYNRISFSILYKAKNEKEGFKKFNTIKEHMELLPRNWKLSTGFSPLNWNNTWCVMYSLSDGYIKEDKKIVTYFDKILPTLKMIKNNSVKSFLCHASEDKAIVEKIGNEIKKKGADVWFDKWEIKIGDSIVERVNEGLTKMTHLVIFLSKNSVDKPWVKKELSSALMRKLNSNSIKVLPVVLEAVEIPTIISDLKYADLVTDENSGIEQLINDLISE